jgi:hypothetical protein
VEMPPAQLVRDILFERACVGDYSGNRNAECAVVVETDTTTKTLIASNH